MGEEGKFEKKNLSSNYNYKSTVVYFLFLTIESCIYSVCDNM